MPSSDATPAVAVIAVEGADTDLQALWDWLRHEPDLRGRIRAGHAAAPTGAMGMPVELIVALSTASAALASVLARSLTTWLVQRRSDVTLRITGPTGQRIVLDTKRIADAEKLVRTVLEATGSTALPAAPRDNTSEG